MGMALVHLVAGISLLPLLIILGLPVPIASSNSESSGSTTFQNLITLFQENNLDVFWGEQAKDSSSFLERETRALQDEEDEEDEETSTQQQQEFGERCGTNHPCRQGLNCTEVENSLSLGNRCLPTSHCLEETFLATTTAEGADPTLPLNDMAYYKEMLFQAAGYSQDEILAALANARNERAFLETNEFQALRQALHTNMETLAAAFTEMSNTCIDNNSDSKQATGTVTYIGLHIEAGGVIDGSINYLAALNGKDQKSFVRFCLGSELGVSAEISYIFGFTNTALTENLGCASVFADVDAGVGLFGGAAVGIAFNGVFFYEFTVGGGLGLGLGGGICASFLYGTTSV